MRRCLFRMWFEFMSAILPLAFRRVLKQRSMRSPVTKYGEDHYAKTLGIIKDTWGGVQESLEANMLGGVAAFLKEFGDVYDCDRFIKKLRDVLPKEIRTLSRRNRIKQVTRIWTNHMRRKLR